MTEHKSADRRGPPAIGLALMAWRLAGERSGFGVGFTEVWKPCSRQSAEANDRVNACSAMYYRIIDCVTYGHVWRAEKEFASCGRCHNTKAMRDFKPGEYLRGY